MGKCNYCLVEAMKAHAKNSGEVVTVLPIRRAYLRGNLNVMVGYDVFIHPPEVTVTNDQAIDIQEEAPPYFAAWLAALPDHCVCSEDS
jgi:hypothetical protein